MTARISKELRLLWLPWVVAVLSAVAIPLFQELDAPPFREFLRGLAVVAFFGSCLLMAASSVGTELQYRTLALLLSQPAPRALLWREKLRTLALAVGSAAVVYAGADALLVRSNDTPYGLIFLTGAACSATFWTLCARSIIGGAVLTVTFTGTALLLPLLVQKSIELLIGFESAWEPDSIKVCLPVGLAYSVLLLFLGYWKFERLEVAGLEAGGVTVIEGGYSSLRFARWCTRWLRCRSTGVSLNLVRKELCLLKPAFLVTSVFLFGWLVVLGLSSTRYSAGLINLFDVLICLQIPAVCVLASTAPLGEERTLGVAEWQLVQPVSVWRQWCIKLGVGLGVALLLAWGLPLLLNRLTAPFFPLAFNELLQAKEHQWSGICWLSVTLFMVGFWAAALVGNTIRASLTAVLGFAVGLACFFCGTASGVKGLQAGFLLNLITHFQLDPYAPSHWLEAHATTLFAAGLAVVLLCLAVQGYLQFRRARCTPGTAVRYPILIAALIFGLGYWYGDLAESCQHLAHSPLEGELVDALQSIPTLMAAAPAGKPRPVAVEDLVSTGRLSKGAQTWINGASVFCQTLPSRHPDIGLPWYVVTVSLKNGGEYSFSFQGPPRRRSDATSGH